MNNALIKILSNFFESQPIDKAWIFGSYARSEENINSDIDILVNFTFGARISLLKYTHIVNELQELTGKKVDMVENGQLKQFALSEAEKNKILIYERKAQR